MYVEVNVEVTPVNKIYHTCVLLFCAVCCGLSLFAWKRASESNPQNTEQVKAIGSAPQDLKETIPTPGVLSPRILNAFAQAHRSNSISGGKVVLASWAPDAAEPNQARIVSLSDRFSDVTMNWTVSKTKEVWLRGKNVALNWESGNSPSVGYEKIKFDNTSEIQLSAAGTGNTKPTLTATFSQPGVYRLSLKLGTPDENGFRELTVHANSTNPDVIVFVPASITSTAAEVSIKRGQDYDWEKPGASKDLSFFVNTLASLMVKRTTPNTEIRAVLGSITENGLNVEKVLPFSGDVFSYKTPSIAGSESLVIFENDPTSKDAWVSNQAIKLSIAQTDSGAKLVDFKIEGNPTKIGEKTKLNDSGASRTISLSNGSAQAQAESLYKLFLDGKQIGKQLVATSNGSEIDFSGMKLSEGQHRLFASLTQGDNEVARTPEVEYEMQTGGFRVIDIFPKDFGIAINSRVIEIKLSRPIGYSSLAKLIPSDGPSKLSEVFKVRISESGSRNGPFSGDSGGKDEPKIEVLSDRQRIQLTFTSVKAGIHQISIYGGEDLKDEYGNKLEGSNGKAGELFTAILGAPAGGANRYADPLVPGVIAGRAPVVEYPSVIPARDQPKGFNPNDRVETRVARLYFYRDAHRVAQILNRRAQSYGRQDVSYRRQLADQARREAEESTTKRQNYERSAVTSAQKTRELESKLNDAEQSLNYTLNQMQRLVADQSANTNKEKQLAQLEIAARAYTDQIRALESQVLVAREQELASNEQWLQSQRTEELNKAEQFRLETAAAHTDPDTFAEGRPDSVDAVHQVSISVIGEGVLHLRGPLRGVNQVRMMIDQIDTPCGSVKINIHSTQINGDEADELEVVANRLQTYIDQARFMTMQSSETLRKAVLTVASEKADEARVMYPGDSQEERDQRYLYAFFGKDFIDELKVLDSELLHTGNKLLSLHSMDVTSLSSALTLMALANNSTRLAILARFEELVQSDLGPAEQRFLENSIAECTGKQCKFGCRFRCKHKEPPPIFHLTPSASFTSMRGFFDAIIANDDTLNPIQREMIRLAQILKARLVTELELKQRVMERAVIEERLSAVESDQDLMNLEQRRLAQLRATTEQALTFRSTILPTLSKATSQIDTAVEQYESISMELIEMLRRLTLRIGPASRDDETVQEKLIRIKNLISSTRDFRAQQFQTATEGAFTKIPTPEISKLYGVDMFLHGKYERISEIYSSLDPAELDSLIYLTGSKQQRQELQGIVKAIATHLDNVEKQLNQIDLYSSENSQEIIVRLKDRVECVIQSTGGLVGRNSDGQPRYAMISVYDLEVSLDEILMLLGEQSSKVQKLKRIQDQKTRILEMVDVLFSSTQLEPIAVKQAFHVYQEWVSFLQSMKELLSKVNTSSGSIHSQLKGEIIHALNQTDDSFNDWIKSISQLDTDRALLQANRRPLDHKKFLDMLIDELEEKFIELLEGTRAHTANVDNYLKRLTTALDDDFNTQFYYPMFRAIRKGSQAYKVEFGQTETTNVLANNRELGKVSPSATMEFDLPRRDILVREGIDSALAVYNDAGALIQDPNFLALAKMKQGGVTSPTSGVVNVLPSLSNPSAEQMIRQNAGSGPRFESNVEKLIPDPAIYKFETGTGYEIRPVIAPDGQAVVFDFNYMYTTQVREPVRADEKHLGRVRQHFIDTDVHLSNFELREVSRYVVALKAARTAKGVPLLEDIPVVGALWRPLPSDEKSLQQNIIMAQATIFPTLFDLMGLRWAPAVSDVDPLQLSNREYIVRNRNRYLENRIYDYSSSKVDEFLRIPESARRADLYRSQESIPTLHPNGYEGPGLDYQVTPMQEGYDPQGRAPSNSRFPGKSSAGKSGYLSERFEEVPAKRVIREGVTSLEPNTQGQPVPPLMNSPAYRPSNR
jgi:hypothetical protein